MTESVNSLFVAIIGLQNLRPLRPGIGFCPFCRGLRHHFQSRHRLTAVPDHRADAVIAGITSADHYHILTFCTDEILTLQKRLHVSGIRILPASGFRIESLIQKASGCGGQEVHCVINALDFVRIRTGKGACLLGAAGKNHSIIGIQKLLCGDILADIHPGFKFHALCFHQLLAAVNDALIELHVGNPIHEKPADPVLPLVNCHKMSSVIKLIRCRKSGRAAADDSNPLAASDRRDSRLDKSVCICSLNHKKLIVMDRNRFSVFTVDARLLAQCWTYSSGKLRKIARLDQAGKCMLVMSVIDLVIPFRNQIVQRTPGHHTGELHRRLAQRNAAVHAARSLLFPFLLGKGTMKLFKIRKTLLYRNVRVILTFKFQKSSRLAHYAVTSSNASRTALSCDMPCSSYLLIAASIF